MSTKCFNQYWGVGGVFAGIFRDYLCYVENLGQPGFPSQECTCGVGTDSTGYPNPCGAKIHKILGEMRRELAGDPLRNTSPPPSYACDPPFTWQKDADCFCTEENNQQRIEVNLTKLRGVSEGGGCSEGLMWCAMARLHKGDPTDTQSTPTDTDCRTGCPVNSSDWMQDVIFGSPSGFGYTPPSHLNITLQTMPALAARITSFINETKQALTNYYICNSEGVESSRIPKPDTSNTLNTGREFNP